jgi:hypothetical protein
LSTIVARRLRGDVRSVVDQALPASASSSPDQAQRRRDEVTAYRARLEIERAAESGSCAAEVAVA